MSVPREVEFPGQKGMKKDERRPKDAKKEARRKRKEDVEVRRLHSVLNTMDVQ
jgi:hypothetical protein